MHITIRRMAKQHRISSILMQRCLCFLGHLIRMPDNCLGKQLLVLASVGGKLAVGGQKCQWNDIVLKDLRLCNLLRTWWEEAQEHVSWHATIKHSVSFLNKQAKVNEKSSKDEMKRCHENRLRLR